MELAGKRVAVTRAADQQKSFADLLRAHGADPIFLPTIEIVGVQGQLAQASRKAVRRAARGDYTAVLFTSANGVKFYLALAEQEGQPQGKIFAIGRKTRTALEHGGISEVVLAQSSISEGLLTAVREILGASVATARILLPRAREGRDTVIRGLSDDGAQVDVVAMYETRPIQGMGPLPPSLDWVTFASPSAVRGFLASYTLPPRVGVACIGPVTARAAREARLPVHAVSRDPSIEGMVAAMEDIQLDLR